MPRRLRHSGSLKYTLTDGQKDAEALGYIPLPANVTSKDLAAVQTITN